LTGRFLECIDTALIFSLIASTHVHHSVASGEKEIINPKDRCKKCEGRKTNREKKIIEVHIDKGMQDGQTIRFSGEGDQEPGYESGDIVIVIDLAKHEVFERRKQDLVMSIKLELVESLCGFTRVIPTLDHRTLVIKSRPGEVVKHGDMRSIESEGMPRYKNPFEKGRLIIIFEVNFPPNNFLPEDQLTALRKLLLQGKGTRISEPLIPDEAEECVLHPYVPEAGNSGGGHSHGGPSGLVYDSDDEDGGSGMPGQRVQCGTQ